MAKKVYIITETQADGEVLKFILGLENNPDIECRVFPTSYGNIPSTASTIDIIVRERYEDARIVVAFNSYFLKNKKILCEEKLDTLRFIVGHSPYVALFCFHSTIENVLCFREGFIEEAIQDKVMRDYLTEHIAELQNLDAMKKIKTFIDSDDVPEKCINEILV